MAEYYPFLGEPDTSNANFYNGKGIDVNPDLLPGIIHHKAAFAHVDMKLAQGQQVLADGGSMIWMDAAVQMETQVGSCTSACWRRCAGESCCQNKYTGPGRIAFSFKLPGDMIAFSVNKEVGWKLSAGAFVCGTANIEVSTQFAGCFACVCGGEEAWLTQCRVADDSDSPEGLFYAGGYGAITKHELKESDVLMLSAGCFFAAAEDHSFELRMPGGCTTCLWGGEGLVVAFKGPGEVFSQNRNPAIWKPILRRQGPQKKGK